MESLVNHNLDELYRDKKVFVTGHTGFKGAWLITWLHSLGAKIRGYALAPQHDRGIYNVISGQVSHQSVIANLLDRDRLQKEILDFEPDYIFHLAAQALVRKSYKMPADTFDVNVTGTAYLLESVVQLKNRCAVVIVTTDKVYENNESGQLYTETDRLGGYDPYSASKACVEILTASFNRSFFRNGDRANLDKKIVTARAGNVIGGGDWNSDRIVPDIIGHLENKESIIVRNPDSIRPWQHVLEPLGGYLILGGALLKGIQLDSEAFNFGPTADDHLTVSQLVQEAIACWGSGDWQNHSDASQPHEAGVLKLDITLAGQHLNWYPKLNSREAIRWTLDWYKQHADNAYTYTLSQINSYQSL